MKRLIKSSLYLPTLLLLLLLVRIQEACTCLTMHLFKIAAGSSEDSKFVFEGDEDDEDDLEDDEGKVLDDIEIPLADDLELAWENLDLARLIYAQQEGNEYAMQLAEVHLSLGDVSLESGIFF